jgi:hypothetical protein
MAATRPSPVEGARVCWLLSEGRRLGGYGPLNSRGPRGSSGGLDIPGCLDFRGPLDVPGPLDAHNVDLFEIPGLLDGHGPADNHGLREPSRDTHDKASLTPQHQIAAPPSLNCQSC